MKYKPGTYFVTIQDDGPSGSHEKTYQTFTWSPELTPWFEEMEHQAEVRARIDELKKLIGSGAAGDVYRLRAEHGFLTVAERMEQLESGDEVTV